MENNWLGISKKNLKWMKKREISHLCRAEVHSVQGLKGSRLGCTGLSCCHLSVEWEICGGSPSLDKEPARTRTQKWRWNVCVCVWQRERDLFNPCLVSEHLHHFQTPGSEAPAIKDSLLPLSLPPKSLSADFPGGWLLSGTSWHRTPSAG